MLDSHKKNHSSGGYRNYPKDIGVISKKKSLATPVVHNTSTLQPIQIYSSGRDLPFQPRWLDPPMNHCT